jgi:DNA mismatch repair protein MutL
MGIIKILPPHEAQKIAAGEVVERPANVVKELLENALDAGSLHTSLMLFEGGKRSITIIDTGSGMSLEDARLAIHNHATSKLHSVQDLQSVATFGFRGEALASIAAVSHMTLVTKTEDSAEGFKLTIADGKIISEEIIACNTGTTITIDDLFYNLPARKKFLKKEETEWNAIYLMFQALCLAHGDRSFTLFHNDHRVVHAPAVRTLSERMAQLFDTQLASRMIACQADKKEYTLSMHGVISHPTHHRYDRNQIFLYVNNRWIKNHKLVQSLLKGYASVLPPQRYPSAAIFITIDPAYVDINIHPRKEEVQFLHPRVVEELLQKMVYTTLQTTTAADLGVQEQIPVNSSLIQKSEGPLQNSILSKASIFQNSTSHSWAWGTGKNNIPTPHVIKTALPEDPMQAVSEVSNPRVQQMELITVVPVQDHLPYRLVGSVLDTYIIIETDEGMVLIDQHAAHERVLYDLLEKNFENMATTQLMFPQLITIAEQDCKALLPWLSLFHANGILLEPLSATQLIVKALPTHLKNIDINDIVKETAGWIHENSALDAQEFHKFLHDALRAMMACKAAIKAGDKLDEQQMHELIKKVYATKNRMTCPHGRPTTWKITKSDIERKFKRIE